MREAEDARSALDSELKKMVLQTRRELQNVFKAYLESLVAEAVAKMQGNVAPVTPARYGEPRSGLRIAVSPHPGAQ